MIRDAAEKFPNLFQILSAFAAHADAGEFDLDEIVRRSFSPSPHVTQLVQGGLREFKDLRQRREFAGVVISKFANRHFAGTDDPIAWLSAVLQKLSCPTA